MEAQQREIAQAAVFTDDLGFDPADLEVREPVDEEPLQEADFADNHRSKPIVAGIDQAFQDEHGVSAVVAIQDGAVIEQVCGRAELAIPYIPGLLAFREGAPILDALKRLSVEPDLLVFDGSGRIHYRQAGIATHVGVIFDRPAIGVTKNLLCGTPTGSLEGALPAGSRVPILADEAVDAPDGTELGYAFQSRQFPNPSRRHVNPVYVSPGHRVGVDRAVDLVETLCAGYKLPEPIRLADSAAAECKE